MEFLQEKFEGNSRETRGFRYGRVAGNGNAYIYGVCYPWNEGCKPDFYEVFKVKISPAVTTTIGGVKVEFKERERYPRGEDFGSWAKTCYSIERAMELFEEFSK